MANFAQMLAAKGRSTDNAKYGGVVGHLGRGDVVVPEKLIAVEPGLLGSVMKAFGKHGGDWKNHMAGMGKINPNTGLREFAYEPEAESGPFDMGQYNNDGQPDAGVQTDYAPNGGGGNDTLAGGDGMDWLRDVASSGDDGGQATTNAQDTQTAPGSGSGDANGDYQEPRFAPPPSVARPPTAPAPTGTAAGNVANTIRNAAAGDLPASPTPGATTIYGNEPQTTTGGQTAPKPSMLQGAGDKVMRYLADKTTGGISLDRIGGTLDSVFGTRPGQTYDNSVTPSPDANNAGAVDEGGQPPPQMPGADGNGSGFEGPLMGGEAPAGDDPWANVFGNVPGAPGAGPAAADGTPGAAETFTQPPLMAAPAFLGLSEGMNPLQQRAALATYGANSEDPIWRDPLTQEYFKNLISRSLVGEDGTLGDIRQLLPVEHQYLQQVLGLSYNPGDTKSLLQAMQAGGSGPQSFQKAGTTWGASNGQNMPRGSIPLGNGSIMVPTSDGGYQTQTNGQSGKVMYLDAQGNWTGDRSKAYLPASTGILNQMATA